MNIGKLSVLFLLSLLMLFTTACQTDYRTSAAEQARSYALEHSRDLSETDRNFIRYNDPVLMSDLLYSYSQPAFSSIGTGPNRFDEKATKRNSNYDYMHTAFVWHLPKAGFSLVVDGAGERNQRAWRPIHVVYKKFVPENTAFSAAKIKAVNFIANFFPDLKASEINTVRFEEPLVSMTSFYLPQPESANRDAQIKKWMNYIRTGKGEVSEKTQISLIWTSPIDGKKLIVTGEAPKKNLYGWKPVKASILESKELEEYLLKEKISLKDPQNEAGETVITPPENAESLKKEKPFHRMKNDIE